MSTTWNPWHGCTKLSAGCDHCYVYRIDAKHDRDSSVVKRTQNFDLPLKKSRSGKYKIPPGDDVYACFSSDFFLDTADNWRPAVWEMIRFRSDCHFLIITKRIDRFGIALPDDWGSGYNNVTIGCTVENQLTADHRLPIFERVQVKRKFIICEPLLGPLRIERFLGNWVAKVVAGGESGDDARVCDYNWVLDLRAQCEHALVPFHFKQTGAKFSKDGRLFNISRRQQHLQAQKAGIDLQF